MGNYSRIEFLEAEVQRLEAELAVSKMSEKNDIFAFPVADQGRISPGMTLRDWFAGMALQGMLQATWRRDAVCASGYANDSYALADAMLAERGKAD